MNIVTTTSVFPIGYSSVHALERLKKVGFQCLDLAFDYCVSPEELHPKPSPYLHTEAEYPFESNDWKTWAKNLRMCADELGVKYTQAHAPYGAECHNEIMFRSFEVCRILGIRQMVVHPVWHNSENRILEDKLYLHNRFQRAFPPTVHSDHDRYSKQALSHCVNFLPCYNA